MRRLQNKQSDQGLDFAERRVGGAVGDRWGVSRVSLLECVTRLFGAFCALSAAVSCGGETDELAQARPSNGIELNFLDEETDPCDDFYQYACGGWSFASRLRVA